MGKLMGGDKKHHKSIMFSLRIKKSKKSLHDNLHLSKKLVFGELLNLKHNLVFDLHPEHLRTMEPVRRWSRSVF